MLYVIQTALELGFLYALVPMALFLSYRVLDIADLTTDGSFVLVYLGDGRSEFTLELTWLRDHPQKYNLGECEFHLALKADEFDAMHRKHEEMGCISFENPAMGIYFVTDPDGYWIEIIP